MRRTGFTMPELLTVVLIVLIVAAIAYPVFFSGESKG